MKPIRVLLTAFLTFGSLLFGNPAVLSGDGDLRDLIPPDTVQLSQPRTHEGIRTNDLFALAAELDLRGRYLDDAWAAARRTVFEGEAEEDLRLFALETIQVNGSVGDSLDAIAPGGNIVVNTNTTVHGDSFLLAGRNATLQGTFLGDVEVRGSRVTVDSRIQGDLTLVAREVLFLPGSSIGGDLRYTTPEPLTLNTNMVAGTIHQILPVASKSGFLTFRLIHWVSALFTGLLLLRTLPRFSGNCVECAYQRRGHSVIFGGMASLLLAAIVLLAAQSGIGIGFAGVLGGAFFLLLYTGKLVIALAVGALLFRQWRPFTFGRLSLAFLAGLVLLYSSFEIPYIGASIWLLTSCWGMGAMLQVIAASQRPLQVEVPPSMTEENPTILS